MTILLLLLMGLVLWLWQDNLRAREQAWQASAQACQRCGVQLLDDTVALEGLGWRRNRNGGYCLERIYLFEFTDDGTTRRLGRLVILGRQVEILCMEGNDLIIP